MSAPRQPGAMPQSAKPGQKKATSFFGAAGGGSSSADPKKGQAKISSFFSSAPAKPKAKSPSGKTASSSPAGGCCHAGRARRAGHSETCCMQIVLNANVRQCRHTWPRLSDTLVCVHAYACARIRGSMPACSADPTEATPAGAAWRTGPVLAPMLTGRWAGHACA
eukprot:363767-Chlamydomonas_euryale.AAC.4